MDHPSGDGPNSYVVSGAVKNAGLTVAISGLGGDELFAGYPFFTRYLELKKRSYLLSFPKYARSIGASLIKMKNKGIQGQKIAETLTLPYFDVPHTYPINRRSLVDSEIASLLAVNSFKDALFFDLKSRFDYKNRASTLPELSKVSLAELTTYMQSVLLRDTDQMSMAHALEVRVPFLDHKLVEYVLGVNDKIKYPHFAKSLLVNSFEGLLPDEVVPRPKMGFVLPWEHWMKNELSDLCRQSLSYLEESTHFKAGKVMKLYQRFLAGDRTITWSRIWPLVSLGHWMKENQVE
jgi:asparagine synthase (glutamine-hydrolysing)